MDENDNDDMDIDPADYELDTDGLNAEELEDVERNRKLLAILTQATLSNICRITVDLFNSMTRGGGDGKGCHGNRISQILIPTMYSYSNYQPHSQRLIKQQCRRR